MRAWSGQEALIEAGDDLRLGKNDASIPEYRTTVSEVIIS